MGTLESIGSILFVVGWIGFVFSFAWAAVVTWKTKRAPITQGRLVVSAMALIARRSASCSSRCLMRSRSGRNRSSWVRPAKLDVV